MAVNKMTWVRNLLGAPEPFVYLGSFQAGSTQAICQGEILEFTADTNSDWCPIDSDFNMAANIAVAACEIKSGDKAGYYPIYVPRPGDVWEYALAAAGATAYGTSLYYSASQTVTVTTGSYVLGYAVGQANYPQPQGFASDGDWADRGTSIRSQSYVHMTFRAAVSLWAALCA